jgi:hypothetical protein
MPSRPRPARPGWQDSGDRFVAWQCIVAPRADGRWSGRIALVAAGSTIGTGSAAHRVCRYGNDANIAVLADEANVGAALLGRNFVVVGGNESCPAAPPTEPHQP